MNRPTRNAGMYAGGLLVILASTIVLLGSTMQLKIVEEKEFSIIGIGARTNNAKEMTNDGAIPKQWNKFFAEGVLARIPDKVDSTIYAVYTDYASDRNGDYTYVIGAKVNDMSAIPSGMVKKRVPGGKYTIVSSSKGPVQSIVAEAWKQIWSLEDKSQLGGERAYKADFEVYDQRSQNPQDSQVDVYIGIK